MGCEIKKKNKKTKNVRYEVKRINGDRIKEVISVFERLNDYLFYLQLVSEPGEK